MRCLRTRPWRASAARARRPRGRERPSPDTLPLRIAAARHLRPRRQRLCLDASLSATPVCPPQAPCAPRGGDQRPEGTPCALRSLLAGRALCSETRLGSFVLRQQVILSVASSAAAPLPYNGSKTTNTEHSGGR